MSVDLAHPVTQLVGYGQTPLSAAQVSGQGTSVAPQTQQTVSTAHATGQSLSLKWLLALVVLWFLLTAMEQAGPLGEGFAKGFGILALLSVALLYGSGAMQAVQRLVS